MAQTPAPTHHHPPHRRRPRLQHPSRPPHQLGGQPMKTHFDVFSNLILAWFFLCIGILFNTILWSSLGYGWIGFMMGALGAGFDLAKVRLLNNSVNTFRAARYGLGSFFGIWFIIMTLLSMFAAAGFYALTVTTTQHEAAIASDAYQTAAQRANNAQTELDKLAAYTHLDSAALRSERDQALDAVLNQTAQNMAGQSAGSVRSRVGDCTGSTYYHRQYCPQIQNIKEQYATQITQAEAAESAQARLDSALDDKTSASTNASIGIPIFGVIGYLLSDAGKSPEQAEHDAYMAFVIVTAVVTELLSSVLFIAANVFGKHVRPTFEQIRQVKLAELEIEKEFKALKNIGPNLIEGAYPKP
jgi:hypothetical protein